MRGENDRAQEVLAGRAEIAQMISHEIKGPISTIKGLVETSERHYDRLGEAERKEFLLLIKEESGRLLRIADQAATALKVDAGTLSYIVRPEDLAETVQAGVRTATARGHPLRLELEPGVRMPIDRERIGEAVRQLVDNAAAFSPEGAEIEVHSYRKDSSAVVEVIDRGPGIPAADREEVFRKFPAVRPPGYEQVPGAGLGLFISRAHVREHGGDIVATDAPGGGTMLRITLPCKG